VTAHRVAVIVTLVALVTATGSRAASAPPACHRSVVVKSGSVTLAKCPGIFMRATIVRSTYQPRQTVNVFALVENRSASQCVFGGAAGSSHQHVGPCGAFSLTVTNGQGVSIWPGPVAPSCPAIMAVSLPPGGRIVATGAWPLTIGFSGSSPAPPGKYRVVIGGSIAFFVKITSDGRVANDDAPERRAGGALTTSGACSRSSGASRHVWARPGSASPSPMAPRGR
jgi:hypothetical protein